MLGRRNQSGSVPSSVARACSSIFCLTISATTETGVLIAFLRFARRMILALFTLEAVEYFSRMSFLFLLLF